MGPPGSYEKGRDQTGLSSSRKIAAQLRRNDSRKDLWLEMLLGILPENLLYDSLSLMSSGKESKKSGKLPESPFFSRLKDVSFLSCRILSGMVPVRRLPPKLSSVN
nr:hypothetical protein Itr_chr12CG11660 [Ipomoea trifida]